MMRVAFIRLFFVFSFWFCFPNPRFFFLYDCSRIKLSNGQCSRSSELLLVGGALDATIADNELTENEERKKKKTFRSQCSNVPCRRQKKKPNKKQITDKCT